MAGLSVALGVVWLLLYVGIGVRDLPGDLLLYFDYANAVDDGRVLYRDWQVEYPPLALLPMVATFYLAPGSSFTAYEATFAVLTWLLAVGCGVCVWLLLRRTLPGDWPAQRWRLVAFVAAFPLLGQLVQTRFDLFPTLLTMLALLLWLDGRERLTWCVVAAGIATKLVPGLLAPLLAIDLLRRRNLRAALLAAVECAAWCVLWFLPALLASPAGLKHAFTYHSGRGVQIESVWGNVVLFAERLLGLDVVTANAWGAFETVSAWTDPLRTASTLTQLLLLGAGYLLLWRGRWQVARHDAHGRAVWLLGGATLVHLLFIVSGKVLSPQYLIWIIPLIVLLPGAHGSGNRILATFAATLVATQLLFPYAYSHLLERDALGLAVLTTRNLLLLLLTAQVARWCWVAPAPERGEAQSFVRGAQRDGVPLSTASDEVLRGSR